MAFVEARETNFFGTWGSNFKVNPIQHLFPGACMHQHILYLPLWASLWIRILLQQKQMQPCSCSWALLYLEKNSTTQCTIQRKMKSIDFGIQIDPFKHFGIKHLSLKTKHNNFYQTFQYLSSGTTSKKPN